MFIWRRMECNDCAQNKIKRMPIRVTETNHAEDFEESDS